MKSKEALLDTMIIWLYLPQFVFMRVCLARMFVSPLYFLLPPAPNIFIFLPHIWCVPNIDSCVHQSGPVHHPEHFCVPTFRTKMGCGAYLMLMCFDFCHTRSQLGIQLVWILQVLTCKLGPERACLCTCPQSTRPPSAILVSPIS